MTRIQRAQLAKLKIDWGPHQVVETYPARLPELWAGRPVIVYGRYRGGSSGRITISGQVEGQNVSWPLDVQLPAAEPQHDVLAKVWARQKIESLMQSSYYQGSPAVEEEVTALGLGLPVDEPVHQLRRGRRRRGGPATSRRRSRRGGCWSPCRCPKARAGKASSAAIWRRRKRQRALAS